MTAHRFHPDPEDPFRDDSLAVLFDRCDRCDELANWADPDNGHRLTGERFGRLAHRMIDIEVDQEGPYRSDNEKKAIRPIWKMYLDVEELGSGLSTFFWSAVVQVLSAELDADEVDHGGGP